MVNSYNDLDFYFGSSIVIDEATVVKIAVPNFFASYYYLPKGIFRISLKTDLSLSTPRMELGADLWKMGHGQV